MRDTHCLSKIVYYERGQKRQSFSLLLLLTNKENVVLAKLTSPLTHFQILVQCKWGDRAHLGVFLEVQMIQITAILGSDETFRYSFRLESVT
jgi:hypothetical protein